MTRWVPPFAALAAAALLLVCAPGPAESVQTLRSPQVAADVTAPLVAAVALLAWALAAWLLVTALLTAGSRLPGWAGTAAGALLRRVAPAAVRRAVALALGVGVSVGGLGVSAASAATPFHGVAVMHSMDDTPRSTSSLDWPSGTARGPGPSAGGTGKPPGDVVVVRPGDTLWDLAAADLPTSAGPRDVAAAWPSWWSANREVIGEDPDRLLPGQRLEPPGPAPG